MALSVRVTYETVFGVSWSPDGTKIAFGCTDNTVRAIDAKTGEQVLFSDRTMTGLSTPFFPWTDRT